MAVQVPRLKRGLFGYRPKIVRTILTGREIMFARVWQRLQRAEAERDQARADLEASRRDLEIQTERARMAEEQSYGHAERAETARAEAAELRSLNESLRARIDDLEAAALALEAHGGEPVPEDLSEVLEAAEQAVSEIIVRARRQHEEQLEAIETARRELWAETARLAEWRAELERILPPASEALGRLADTAKRLPAGTKAAAPPTATWTVRIPEATNGSNGSASREDLAAIQELYGSS
jgi:DNA repair exonuclease SbcCD ATPase subunit